MKYTIQYRDRGKWRNPTFEIARDNLPDAVAAMRRQNQDGLLDPDYRIVLDGRPVPRDQYEAACPWSLPE